MHWEAQTLLREYFTISKVSSLVSIHLHVEWLEMYRDWIVNSNLNFLCRTRRKEYLFNCFKSYRIPFGDLSSLCIPFFQISQLNSSYGCVDCVQSGSIS